MRPRKQYVVQGQVGIDFGSSPTPNVHNFSTVNWKPRSVLDLRYKRGGVDLDDVLRAIRRYQTRKFRDPERIRLSEMALDQLGSPTHLFGFKVTR